MLISKSVTIANYENILYNNIYFHFKLKLV